MSEPAVIAVEQEDRAIDGRQLRVMMAAAAYHARRVARTMRLADDQREDVEQDIVLALLERRRFFDPSRGAWSSFAERVARQVAQGLADEIGADRRVRAGSLDGPPDDGETAGAPRHGRGPTRLKPELRAVAVGGAVYRWAPAGTGSRCEAVAARRRRVRGGTAPFGIGEQRILPEASRDPSSACLRRDRSEAPQSRRQRSSRRELTPWE